uniref:DNA-directed RNA polymerase subunit alpha n=1 Tax=candidate division WOR-3 bacterium TaxID=2052148 RepID=A0A7C4Y6Q7_UNCW3
MIIKRSRVEPQIYMEERNEKYGRFVIKPLERGYGITIGHALRRMLLSSMQSAAITAVRIEGVKHEFSTIPDVLEDVPEIILNLKKVKFRVLTEDLPKFATINKRGKCILRAQDIETPENIVVVNPDQYIATLGEGANFVAELKIDLGKGYVPQEYLKDPELPLGYIFLDTNFSPIVRVKYYIENELVGQSSDYERLIIEIWTDGSIYPEESLAHSAKIMIDHLNLLVGSQEFKEIGAKEKLVKDEEDELRELLLKDVSILDVSTRISNVLEAKKIRTIGELVRLTEDEIIKFKNFGRKSLNELKDKLKAYNLYLGMDVDKYIGGEK